MTNIATVLALLLVLAAEIGWIGSCDDGRMELGAAGPGAVAPTETGETDN
jgi:hypothetical protein